MRTLSLLPIVFLALVHLSSSVSAQQPATRSRTPKLEMDDIEQTGASRDSASSPASSLSSSSRGGLERYSPGGLSLSLELPEAPQSLPFPPLDTNQRFIEQAEAYYCVDERLQIMVVHFLPREPAPGVAALKLVAAGFLDHLARKNGISNNQSSTEIRGDAVLFKRTYQQNGAQFEMRGLVRAHGRDLWMIVTEVTQSDQEMRQTAARVLDSVQIAR
jgi:hypothetical protein